MYCTFSTLYILYNILYTIHHVSKTKNYISIYYMAHDYTAYRIADSNFESLGRVASGSGLRELGLQRLEHRRNVAPTGNPWV